MQIVGMESGSLLRDWFRMMKQSRIDNIKSGKTKVVSLETVFAKAGIGV